MVLQIRLILLLEQRVLSGNSQTSTGSGALAAMANDAGDEQASSKAASVDFCIAWEVNMQVVTLRKQGKPAI